MLVQFVASQLSNRSNQAFIDAAESVAAFASEPAPPVNLFHVMPMLEGVGENRVAFDADSDEDSAACFVVSGLPVTQIDQGRHGVDGVGMLIVSVILGRFVVAEDAVALIAKKVRPSSGSGAFDVAAQAVGRLEYGVARSAGEVGRRRGHVF